MLDLLRFESVEMTQWNVRDAALRLDGLSAPVAWVLKKSGIAIRAEGGCG